MKVIIGIIVVILIFGGVYYFTQTPPPEPHDAITDVESTMPVPQNEGVVEMVVTEESQAPEPVDEVKAFTVEGKNFSFAPNIMTVKKGDTVRVTFKNVGGFHDFTLDELNAQTKRINEGEETVVEFIADKAGTFEYYCSVGNHRAMGMIGKLTVSE